MKLQEFRKFIPFHNLVCRGIKSHSQGCLILVSLSHFFAINEFWIILTFFFVCFLIQIPNYYVVTALIWYDSNVDFTIVLHREYSVKKDNVALSTLLLHSMAFPYFYILEIKVFILVERSVIRYKQSCLCRASASTLAMFLQGGLRKIIGKN